MTSRELQDVCEQLRGPTGRWLLSLLKEQGEQIRQDACLLVPKSLEEQTEREQAFGASNKLLELVSSIPQKANEQFDEQRKKENSK